MTTFTIRDTWRSANGSSPVSLQLLGGLGALSRGGDAYAELDGTTDLSFVAGGGIRVRLSESVALRLDLEDDLVLSQAIVITIGGR